MKVNIYNINYEVNAEIVQRSKSLAEYSQFIGCIKENLAGGLTLEEAIKKAIEYGIEHDIMREFLETHGTEVSNMLLSGWNMDEALAVSKEEGYEDGYEDGVLYGEQRGKAEGAARERANNIRALKDVLSPEVIAEKFKVPIEYVLAVLKDDSTMVVAEPIAEYKVTKRE